MGWNNMDITIYPKLFKVNVLPDYLLELKYDNNENRLYDFKPNLNHPFYNNLQNPTLFNNVFINDGALEWVTGQDFCPNKLYEKSILQAN